MSFEEFVRNELEECGRTMSDLLLDISGAFEGGPEEGIVFIKQMAEEYGEQYPNEEEIDNG